MFGNLLVETKGESYRMLNTTIINVVWEKYQNIEAEITQEL